ncbi:C-C chemokine receptor type 8-like [Astyanax mexicanus]|uniref:C-C chemokine receptor type 8-like n=1 Tax=Astyanax mexicanus TaxID=7994 RepID=A0A3B1JZ97_ASTMX|nr:C-C chemokine receptor type 8-like [Astyanax mexicanus]
MASTQLNATTSTPWESTSTLFYNYTSDEAVNEDDCIYEEYERYFLPALYCLFFVVGFIGNALVVWVITVGTQLKSTTDVCLLNLALADLLLVLSLPFRAYQMKHGWIFGEVMCTMVFTIHYIGFYSGIFFIVLMSIDRYLAIVHAVLALRVRTRVCGIVSSLVIWVLAVAASFPEQFYIRVENFSSEVLCIDYPNNVKLVTVGLFKKNIVGLLVPLSIMGFCYSMILRRLHRSRLPNKYPMRLIVIVVVVFFCCWTPFNIAEFIGALQFLGLTPHDCEFTKRFTLTLWITEAVTFSHSCLNPFLYVFVGEKFRRHLFRFFREHQSISSSERAT